jgi:hypothetical protein
LLQRRCRGGRPGAGLEEPTHCLISQSPNVGGRRPGQPQILLDRGAHRRDFCLSPFPLLSLAGHSLLALLAIVARVLLLDLCLDRGVLIANRLPAHLQLDFGERPRRL